MLGMVDEVVADEFACPVVITPGVCSAEIAVVRVERYEAAVKGMTCAHCVKAVAAVGRVMGQQVVENRRRRRVPGDGAGLLLTDRRARSARSAGRSPSPAPVPR
jgi:hypothetical protein